MAGNYIVINSKFRPFSFDEMVKPLAIYGQEYANLLESLSLLDLLAEMMADKANQLTDPISYAMYKKYSDDLQLLALAIASQGLNPGSKAAMLNMKSRYNSEILPLMLAYAAREEEKKTLKAGKDADSSKIYDRDAFTTSLDTYLNNKDKGYTLGYNSLSVNEAYATAAKDFANLASKINLLGNWHTTLGGLYWSRAIRQGYSPEQITKLIALDPNAPKELRDLYDNTMNSYLSRGNWDNKLKEIIKDAVNRAASYGIGSVLDLMLSNKAYDYAMLERARLRAAAPAEVPTDHLPFTPIPKTKLNGKFIKGFDVTLFRSDVDFVNKIRANPSILNKSEKGALPKFDYVNPKWDKETQALVRQLQLWNYNKHIRLAADNNQFLPETVEINQKRLAGLMNKYGTNDINVLALKLANTATLTAFLTHDFLFEVTDNNLAKDKILDRINSYSASNGNSGVWEKNTNGSNKRNAVSLDRVVNLFSSKTLPTTIVTNTDNLSTEFVFGGKEYEFDPNIVDPTGRSTSMLENLRLRKALLENVSSKEFERLSPIFLLDLITFNTQFYNLFQLFAKVQGRTLSAKEK